MEIKKCNFIANKVEKAFFAIKSSSFRQPYNHTSWATYMSFASSFPNFHGLVLIIFQNEKLVDLKKRHFWATNSQICLFVSSPLKLGTHYGVAWMGINSYENRGFQPKISPACKHMQHTVQCIAEIHTSR